jgi:hypothetical protein
MGWRLLSGRSERLRDYQTANTRPAGRREAPAGLMDDNRQRGAAREESREKCDEKQAATEADRKRIGYHPSRIEYQQNAIHGQAPRLRW